VETGTELQKTSLETEGIIEQLGSDEAQERAASKYQKKNQS
jgi:hypothetical protein